MTTTSYFSWRDVPKSKWRWANYSPSEIACRGTGSIKINEEALDCLQALRDLIGKPMIVFSGYRSPPHNRRIGGARASKHMEGFDIAMANHDPVAFEVTARKAGFLGFGVYPRSGFMHKRRALQRRKQRPNDSGIVPHEAPKGRRKRQMGHDCRLLQRAAGHLPP